MIALGIHVVWRECVGETYLVRRAACRGLPLRLLQLQTKDFGQWACWGGRNERKESEIICMLVC